MKMAKRILSLVLVLAMIACLSVTAFADGTSNTATIVVKASGNAVDTITVNAGTTVYAAVLQQYGDPDGWSSFTDMNGNTAMALWRLTVKGSQYISGAANGATSGINAQWSTKRPGYGFEGFAYNDDGEIVGYKYVYVGNDFIYTVTNNNQTVDVSDKYMNQYTIQTGDVITISYELVVSRWVAETPFETTEPYI